MTTFRTSARWDPKQRTSWQRERRDRWDDLPKMNRLWFWTQAVIVIVCSVYALDLWIVK